MKSMKAIIWKELRENAKWAVLAALAAGLFCFYTAWNNHHHGLVDLSVMRSLLSWTVVAAPLFGAALSSIQIIPEMRRDQWAFLLHRPATPGALFFGKVIAGLGLYFAALGIPFVCIAIWLATPGHIAAPFMPQLLLGGIADILTGIVFYFAGMLTALRSARWYGTRLIGVVAALVCLDVVISATEFWQALLAIFLAAAVLLPSAYGSFVASGEYGPQSRLSRFGLASVCFVGACAVFWSGMVLIMSQRPASQPLVWRDYELNSNGQILQVARQGSSVLDVRTLDGKQLPHDSISDQAQRSMGFSTLLEIKGDYQYPYRNDNRYFSSMGSHRDVTLFRNFRTGRLVGYSDQDARLIGSLGPDGFSKSTAGPRFADSVRGIYSHVYDQFSNSIVLMQTGDAVFGVDPNHLRVTRLLTVAPPDHLRGVCLPSQIIYSPANAAAPVIYLTNNSIKAVTLAGKPLFTTPIAFDTSIYQRINVSMLPGGDRYFFWYEPFRMNGKALGDPAYVVETDGHGKEVARQVLPPLLMFSTAASNDVRWFGIGAPPAVLAGLSAYASLSRNARFDPIMPIYRKFVHVQTWTVSCLFSLIAAFVAYFIGLRNGWDKKGRLAWAFGVFWLGLPGLLMLLALDRWPARETCAVCGKKRVVNRETCEHCGAAWPMPQRDGTEIIEMEAAA